jgi:hypothetical protein
VADSLPESVAARRVGTAFLGAASLLLGVLEVFLVPQRWGTALVPISIVLAIVGNVVLVRLARRGLNSGGAGVTVLGCWFAPIVLLPMLPRSEGDVLIPGGGTEQWIYLGTLLCGIVAGLVSLLK